MSKPITKYDPSHPYLRGDSHLSGLVEARDLVDEVHDAYPPSEMLDEALDKIDTAIAFHLRRLQIQIAHNVGRCRRITSPHVSEHVIRRLGELGIEFDHETVKDDVVDVWVVKGRDAERLDGLIKEAGEVSSK
jgi:hypothetical protein